MYSIPKFPIALTFLAITISCSNNKNDTALWKSIYTSSSISFSQVSSQCRLYQQSLEEKLYTKDSVKAKMWLLIVTRLHNQSHEILDYITTLEKKITALGKGWENRSTPAYTLLIKEDQAGMLYDKLIAFNQSLLKLDTQLTYHFQHKLPQYNMRPEADPNPSRTYFIASNFNHTYGIKAAAVLAGIKQMIMSTILDMTNYCYQQTASLWLDHSYLKYKPIIIQSANIVKPGGLITVTAGIGLMTHENEMQISINGKQRVINENDEAECTIAAPGKPGTYTIPVSIAFKNVDGTRSYIERQLTYEVKNP